MATTADDVWALLRELAAARKETDRLYQKAARIHDRVFTLDVPDGFQPRA